MSKPSKKSKPAAEAAPKKTEEAKPDAPKASEAKPRKTRPLAVAIPEAAAPAKKEKQEDLVVFAFRLTPAERDLIHKAAGAGKASRYVRALAAAAAGGDEAGVLRLLGGPAPTTVN